MSPILTLHQSEVISLPCRAWRTRHRCGRVPPAPCRTPACGWADPPGLTKRHLGTRVCHRPLRWLPCRARCCHLQAERHQAHHQLTAEIGSCCCCCTSKACTSCDMECRCQCKGPCTTHTAHLPVHLTRHHNSTAAVHSAGM